MLEAPVTLNPFDPRAWGTRQAGNAVWAKVFDRDPETWDLIPRIVTGMPSEVGAIDINDDGTMTVRYEIVRGASWSDGRPVTGEDLAWTASALRDIALTGAFGQDSVLAQITNVDAVDRLAFITFAEPTLAFETALWIVLPSHVLEGVDLLDGTDGSDWPSAGPFVVEEFEPGRSVSFVRNESYWGISGDGSPLPYIDGFTLTGVLTDESWEPDILTGGFLAGDFDVIDLPPSLAEIERVETGEGAVIQAAVTPIIEQLAFQFGNERFSVNEASVNEEEGLRRAIATGIDRSELAAEVGLAWLPVRGFLLPNSTAWPDVDADADALVGELVGEDGIAPVSILSTTSNAEARPAIAEALEAHIAGIGIDYSFELLDSTLFFGEVFNSGTFDVGLWAWGVQDPVDLMRTLDPSLDPPDGDFGGWGALGSEAGPRFTEIRIAAESTISRDELDALVREAEQILADELPLVPLFSRGTYSAHWPDAVSGVVPNGTDSQLTWNVEEWQVPGE